MLVCCKRFERFQALDFSSSFSNIPACTVSVFVLLEYMQWPFFVQDSSNSFMNTDNRPWCTLVSFSRWLNRGWQRKMEQSGRSVQLSLIQRPELLDPAFVSLLQRQLSRSPLKIYIYPWSCTIPSFTALYRLTQFCLDQTCLRGQRALPQYFS